MNARRPLSILTLGILAGLAALGVLNFAPDPIGAHRNLFREGARTTLGLTLLSSAFGMLLGVSIAWVRFFAIPVLHQIAWVFLELIRGTPLLVQILFAYYALPVLLPSLSLNEFWAAAIALSLNVAAYHSEVIRAGMLSISRGQWDAAHVLGFDRLQTFRWIIWPQAIRVMLPGLVSNSVALLKDSALASSIGLLELSLAGNRVTSETFQPVPVLLTVAFLYLVFSFIVSSFATLFEKGFKWTPQ